MDSESIPRIMSDNVGNGGITSSISLIKMSLFDWPVGQQSPLNLPFMVPAMSVDYAGGSQRFLISAASSQSFITKVKTQTRKTKTSYYQNKNGILL